MTTILCTSLYFALLCVWLFAFPLYQRLTSTLPDAPDGYESLQPYIESARKADVFSRKPFTCLYCMTFWLTLFGSLFILLFSIDTAYVPSFAGLVQAAAPAPVASIIAVIIDRLYKSLPITF